MPERKDDIPWISFCMSTYKRAGILKETLELFKKQTFAQWEVVISDNDPDSSAAQVVADAGDDRFRYFANGTNLGMIGSFNKSLERSCGKYIVFITDDDPVYPQMVQTLYDLHLKYPGYGIYAGGHDTVFSGLSQARMAKARVGTNSSLAQWDMGVEKTFNPTEFCRAFLDGTVGGSMLWSVCAVSREIAFAVGGIPDYGTPQMADIGFLLLSGARAGCAYINLALGCRTIHDANYSYSEANYESVYKAPEALYDWVTSRLPQNVNSPQLQQLLAHAIGRDITVVVISIKKMLLEQKVKSSKFEDFQKRFFNIPLMKKWKRKYYIATRWPNTFELLLAARKVLSPPRINAPRK